MQQKKCCEEKHADLLLIGEEGKRYYVLIKNINTFTYDHIFYRRGKEEILKSHIKDCFKIKGKQRIMMPRKG